MWGLPALSKDPCSEMANVKLVADIFLAYSKRPGQESAFELQVRARSVTIQVGKTNSANGCGANNIMVFERANGSFWAAFVL